MYKIIILIFALLSAPMILKGMERESSKKGSQSHSHVGTPASSASPNMERSQRGSLNLDLLREKLSKLGAKDDDSSEMIEEKLKHARQTGINPVEKERILQEVLDHKNASTIIKLQAAQMQYDHYFITACTAIDNIRTHKSLHQYNNVPECIQLYLKSLYAARAAYIKRLQLEFPAKPCFLCEYEADTVLKLYLRKEFKKVSKNS